MLTNFVFFSLLATMAPPETSSEILDTLRLEKLYRWGEHDSIVAWIEPWSRRKTAPQDPCSCFARAMSYLGVSFHALGDSALGNAAFSVALKKDSALSLDRRYASSRIYGQFNRLAATFRAKRAQNDTTNSNSALPASGASQKPTPKKSTRRWILGGTVGVLVVGATAAYFLNREPVHTDVITPIDLR
jgi:hypothetical protein